MDQRHAMHWVFPQYELPFTGGSAGTFAAGSPV
jgi:hypothetical protein